MYYRQCELVMSIGTQRYIQISWIPEKYAVVGKNLKIKNGDWKVVSVGDVRRPEKEASIRSREHLHHRKTTDI